MSDRQSTITLSQVFSEEQLIAISEAADVIACQCPGYLVQLIQQVRKFRHYTSDCMERFPEDAETHEWLSDRASQLESLLSQTIIELMQKEDLIDEQNQVCLTKLAARAREMALRQAHSGF